MSYIQKAAWQYKELIRPENKKLSATSSSFKMLENANLFFDR